jgi:hypothetical protein
LLHRESPDRMLGDECLILEVVLSHGSHLSLVHVFHMIPYARLFVGGTYTIPMLISRGMMGYRPTTIIIELHQFTRPHKSSMRSVHNQMLVQGSTMNGPQST